MMSQEVSKRHARKEPALHHGARLDRDQFGRSKESEAPEGVGLLQAIGTAEKERVFPKMKTGEMNRIAAKVGLLKSV
ncbi:hypothetical protein IDH44_17485 [Paenibacillus sp. IB182496]|uniref:Uncharacterized protein n=1 Tax=Paenibacillus sabuli TaxID=2772509 RepID=A0A927GSW5_9BACL|nr:hypothetical protein [Paenibacillus sabuli]MBD2846993.1 hypothetical protein [Paenibacillus sabuli]